jgi:hypothetical protein
MTADIGTVAIAPQAAPRDARVNNVFTEGSYPGPSGRKRTGRCCSVVCSSPAPGRT